MSERPPKKIYSSETPVNASEAAEAQFEASSEKMRHEWEMTYARETDELTGAAERKVFEEDASRALESMRFSGTHEQQRSIPSIEEFSIAFIDLDNFKSVNDDKEKGGHLVGDKILIRLVEILKEHVRESDVVARFGGDEFYLFLPRADKHKAVEISEEIRTALETDPLMNEFGVTASIGVTHIDATHLKEDDTVETFVKQADAAAYKVKEGGKNATALYEEAA